MLFLPFLQVLSSNPLVNLNAGVEMVALIVGLILSIIVYVTYKDTTYGYIHLQSLIGVVVAVIIGFPVIIILLIGVHQKRPKLFIPHIIYQILVIIALIAGMVTYGLLVPPKGSGDTGTRARLLAITVSQLAGIAFQIKFLVAVVQCYKVFKDDMCDSVKKLITVS